MKELIILRGLPGSGKSTTSLLFDTKAICCADDYHTDRDGNYNWKAENQGKAHSWCQRKCERFMKKEINKIIVNNTSTSLKELKPYLLLAEKYDYRVHSLIVENRHGGKNVHNVPDEVLEKMEKRFNIKLI
ncbi:MAG: AAA family ATPase [Nanoarchaeota archaeon]